MKSALVATLIAAQQRPAPISLPVPELEQGLSRDEILQARRDKGGRAQDRIGKTSCYVPHETSFGAAAARRRRQLARAQRRDQAMLEKHGF